jgi:hypothetical protein
LGFLDTSVQQVNFVCMKAVEDPNLSFATNAQLKQAVSQMLAVGHA